MDAGALHFDRDVAPAAQHRAMHLAERGRGDRRRVEFDERLRHANAQLLLDDPLDVRVRERLEVVLQARERVEVGLRQQVGARREQLPELDERRPERLEVAGERLGARARSDDRRPFDRLEAGVRDEIGAAVLGDEHREILVSAESLGEGHPHYA